MPVELVSRLGDIALAAERRGRDLVTRTCMEIEAGAKRNLIENGSVVTGNLVGSIEADTDGFEGEVGTAVTYACIFDAHTRVTTAAGGKCIGQVGPGNRVLTQTGEWREITTKTAFPAVEKPDLIDITARWRADRDHRLTVTVDHKILVRRGPRNLWVPAGDLRGDDLLYHRTKVSPARGTGRVKECEHCGRGHQGQGKRYCSRDCRDSAWAAGRNPHLGARRSKATRELLSRRATEAGRGLRLNRKLAEKGYRTRHERDVATWLEERGLPFDVQVPLAGSVVDFYLPSKGEIIEADGAFWHQDQERDIERDKGLLAAAPGVEVTHLHFYDKRFTPPLDPEPLPGVRYIPCNPGTRSFVDPEVFEAVPILGRREWRYGAGGRQPHASLRARLYDLSVEGVHSFLAGGILVSNSYVEFGTGERGEASHFPGKPDHLTYSEGWKGMSARPYLIPALEAAREGFEMRAGGIYR